MLFLDYGSLTLEINCEEIVQGSSEFFLKAQIINILGFVIWEYNWRFHIGIRITI